MPTRRQARPALFSRHAARGYLAREAGQAIEDQIERANAVYQRYGVATIARHHFPVSGRPGAMRPVGKGPYDFSGHWLGRPIAYDVKSIGDAASYPDKGASILVDSRHQLEQLRAFRDATPEQPTFLPPLAFLLLYSVQLDCCWILRDIDALLRGERIPVRSKRLTAITHHLPVVHRAPESPEVLLGRAPEWPYLRAIAELGW